MGDCGTAQRPGCSFWSSGRIPIGLPGKPLKYFTVSAGEIPVIEFDQLRWSKEAIRIIESEFIEQEVGPPFRENASGRKLLNLSYWAGYLGKVVHLSYDPAVARFKILEAGAPVFYNESEIIALVSKLLQGVCRDLGLELAPEELSLTRLRQLIRMQISISGEALLGRFFERFEYRRGAQITSEQLWVEFFASCEKERDEYLREVGNREELVCGYGVSARQLRRWIAKFNEGRIRACWIVAQARSEADDQGMGLSRDAEAG